MEKNSKSGAAGLSLKEAMHLQALEGNPLDAEDIAMFEMFDREGWSQAERVAYILHEARGQTITPAAE